MDFLVQTIDGVRGLGAGLLDSLKNCNGLLLECIEATVAGYRALGLQVEHDAIVLASDLEAVRLAACSDSLGALGGITTVEDVALLEFIT